jgi:hypothetical protein
MTHEEDTATDLLNDAQQRCLAALQDTILPASADGIMPGAGEFDFLSHIREQAVDFMPELRRILDNFDDDFARQSLPERVALLQEFAESEARSFDDLLFHVYNCYYQDDRVRKLVGVMPGPPFPRGNSITPGELSLLEGVAERSQGYRR